MRERGDRQLRRDLPVGLRRCLALLALVLLFAVRPAFAWAGPPPIPPGQEEAILELVKPIEFGDRLYAAHTLHSMTIDGATIVFWIAPPDLDDPKDASAYGQVRLYHPDFAPKSAKQIKGFAISLVEPGESGASVQKVAERIEANADASLWGVERLGVDSRSGRAPAEDGEGWWLVYAAALAMLATFFLAVRDKKHRLLAVGLVIVTAALVASTPHDLCSAQSIFSRAIGATQSQRLLAASVLCALGAISLWLIGTRLGLEPFPALVAGMAFAMSPWIVEQAGSDAAAAIAASLVAVSLALMLEAGAAEEGPALILGSVSLLTLALALRGSNGLLLVVIAIAMLRRSEEMRAAHRRWLVVATSIVALLAGLPPYLQHEVAFADVVGVARDLVKPATSQPLVTLLAFAGLFAPRRSKKNTSGLRWFGLAWLLLALSTGSHPMATLPWCFLAALGFDTLFRRPKHRRLAAIGLAAAGIVAGVYYARSGETPQIERCV